MTNVESERLYADLKRTHVGWTDKFTSGYVHGAADAEVRTRPQTIEVDRAAHLEHYALGYLTGFAMHSGSDVETEKWFGYVGLLVEGLKSETQTDKT
jgi:hypothetical protein